MDPASKKGGCIELSGTNVVFCWFCFSIDFITVPTLPNLSIIRLKPLSKSKIQFDAPQIRSYELEPENREKLACENGIHEIIEEKRRWMTGRKIIDGIQETCPTVHVFHRNVLKRNVKYRKPRTLSELYHVILLPPEDSKKLNSCPKAGCILDRPQFAEELHLSMNLIANHNLFIPLSTEPALISRNDKQSECYERDRSSVVI